MSKDDGVTSNGSVYGVCGQWATTQYAMVAWVCDPLKGKQGQDSLHCMHAWRLQKTRKQPAGTLTSTNCNRAKHREERSSESNSTLIFFALHSLMTTTTNLHLKHWRWADFQCKHCMLHSAKPLCADPTLQRDYLSPCRVALQSIIQCVCVCVCVCYYCCACVWHHNHARVWQ